MGPHGRNIIRNAGYANQTVRAEISLLQIIFCRSLLGIVLIGIYYRLTGLPLRIVSPFPTLAIARGVLTFTEHILLFIALVKLLLLEVVALYFTYPAFICLLAPVVLGQNSDCTE